MGFSLSYIITYIAMIIQFKFLLPLNKIDPLVGWTKVSSFLPLAKFSPKYHTL